MPDPRQAGEEQLNNLAGILGQKKKAPPDILLFSSRARPGGARSAHITSKSLQPLAAAAALLGSRSQPD
jgi:hypothetical protein